MARTSSDHHNDPLILGPSGPRKKRRRELLVFVLPSLFTTGNLFCGFFSIIASIRGDWNHAAIGILLAGFFDILDGRVARFAKAESPFGEQYDSMADLVSFGVAPSILMHQWALAPYGRIGFLASFLYMACGALRLARFNVLKQHVEKRYFQGCPSPMAACTVATAVLFYREMGFEAWRSVYMLIVMFGLAAAMVSNVRYRSFKDLAFSSQRGFAYLMLAVGAFVVIAASPEKVIFPLLVAYISGGALAECVRFMRRRFSWVPGKGRT